MHRASFREAIRRNGRLYVQLLIGLTFCIVFTLVVSSTAYYVASVRYAQKRVYEADLDRLSQKSRQMLNMREAAQAVSFQIYRNSNVSKLLYYAAPHPFDIQIAMLELANYSRSLPFIESIYVFNTQNNKVYIQAKRGQSGIYRPDELEDRGILDILAHFEEYRPFTPIPRAYRISPEDEADTPVYTYLCYEAIGRDRTIQSAVVVNIASSWIHQEFPEDADAGRTYILDDRGTVRAGDSLAPQLWSGPDLAWVEEHVRQQPTGYRVARIQGVKSLVSYTSPDDLNWQYLRITPYRHVTAQIAGLRATTLWIAFGILLAGLLLSRIIFRLLYAPIRQMERKVQHLESEKRDSLFTLRQNALRRLLLDTGPALWKVRWKEVARLGIPLDFQRGYRLLLLRIDRFREFMEQRGGDPVVFKFALMNIASEICSKLHRAETVDLDDDGVLVILNAADGDMIDDPGALAAILEEIRKASLEYLAIGLTIAFSPVRRDPAELPAMCRLVREAAQRRFFLGHGAQIDAGQLLTAPPAEYVFPTDKEKRMTDALMAGKIEEARSHFLDIAGGAAPYPAHMGQLALSRLTMTLNNVLAAQRKNAALDAEPGFDEPLPTADRFETVEEWADACFATFADLHRRLARRRNARHETWVRKIDELIARDFADPNLCLSRIAEELGMSPIYLGRLYKQQTLTSIVDVINAYRLDKARAMLLETDRPVAEIAAATGFTNSSYFFRMFKKAFGVTPAEFRRAAPGKAQDS